MESLSVILDGTQSANSSLSGHAQRFPGEDSVKRGIEIIGMPHGTADGRPTVLIGIPLPGGGAVIGETTLALLLTAVDGLRARYGDPRT